MNNLVIRTGYESNSASPTDIIECENVEDNITLIGKVFINEIGIIHKNTQEHQMKYNNIFLEREVMIYTFILNKLIIPYNMRNLLSIYDTVNITFNKFANWLYNSINLNQDNVYYNLLRNTKFLLRLPEIRKYRRPSLTQENDKIPTENDLFVRYDKNNIIRLDKTKYTILFTPKINQLSLKNFVISNKEILHPTEFMNYMFVLFTTIKQLSDKGINQNDLHWGNILMNNDEFNNDVLFQKKYFYVYNDKVLIIDNDFTLIIYDFDRAVIKNENIKELEQYARAGNCSKFHPKRDVTKNICSMYHYIESYLLEHNFEQYSNILNDIENKIIKSRESKMFDILTDEENIHCWFEQEGQLSLLCDNYSLDNDIIDIDSIINWIFSYTSFEKINIELLNHNFVKKVTRQFESGDINSWLNPNIQFYNQDEDEKSTEQRNFVFERIIEKAENPSAFRSYRKPSISSLELKKDKFKSLKLSKSSKSSKYSSQTTISIKKLPVIKE